MNNRKWQVYVHGTPGAYGRTWPDLGITYIIPNMSLMDAAATFVHEMAHVRNLSHVDCYLREILYYCRMSEQLGVNVIPRDYLVKPPGGTGPIVTYRPRLRKFTVSMPNLNQYVKNLGSGPTSPSATPPPAPTGTRWPMPPLPGSGLGP